LGVGSIVGGISTQLYSFTMASYVTDFAAIGNYKVALNFFVLPAFFAVPISTVMFPAFSKLDPKKDIQTVRSVFTSSVKYGALLLVPSTIAMIVLSNSLIGTIYGNRWAGAPFFLVLSILVNLLALFGNLSITSLLSALGDNVMVMKMNLLTLAIAAPLAFVLVPAFGISGVILGPLIGAIPSMFWGLYVGWKKYGVKVAHVPSGVILLASSLAALATYLFLNSFLLARSLQLFIGLSIFLLVFLLSAPILGAVDKNDLNNLRSLSSSLGRVSRLVEVPITIMAWALKIKNSLRRSVPLG
jgi:putative peptidoglycan lipid II flippase